MSNQLCLDKNVNSYIENCLMRVSAVSCGDIVFGLTTFIIEEHHIHRWERDITVNIVTSDDNVSDFWISYIYCLKMIIAWFSAFSKVGVALKLNNSEICDVQIYICNNVAGNNAQKDEINFERGRPTYSFSGAHAFSIYVGNDNELERIDRNVYMEEFDYSNEIGIRKLIENAADCVASVVCMYTPSINKIISPIYIIHAVYRWFRSGMSRSEAIKICRRNGVRDD